MKSQDAEEDADAYAAEYDAENSRLILHKIGDGKIIPANQGVIIVADKDNESVSMTIDDFASVDMPKNDLNGCETEESVSDIIQRLDDVEYYDEVGNFYVMGMVNGKFGFYKYVSGTMPAHKAFLYIPRTTESSSARAITFRFADDITDVKTVSGDNVQSSMFNVQCSMF